VSFGEEQKRIDVTRPKGGEVPVVERGELSLTESFDDGKDGGIDETEAQVRVLGKKLPDPFVVRANEIDDRERVALDICEKGNERARAKARFREPIHLDENRSRNKQWFSGRREQPCAALVVEVTAVHRCEERPGITN
jgi:hypothetical protein